MEVWLDDLEEELPPVSELSVGTTGDDDARPITKQEAQAVKDAADESYTLVIDQRSSPCCATLVVCGA